VLDTDERSGPGGADDAMVRRPVGELIRRWRERRRLSQLELSNQAEVSTRHLSFVETSRATPSRQMVLHLAEHLDVPLRERNQLLLAAGYAPVYPQHPLDSPRMASVRTAVRQVLTGHDPYPALVVDRWWNLVEANAGAGVFIGGLPAHLLTPPVNALRLALHPEGLAPQILNIGEWRGHLLARLRSQVMTTADAGLEGLYRELAGYPGPPPSDEHPADAIVVPLRLEHDGRELSFFSTIATFGTPLDVTVSELMIESFFPADEATAEALRR
jgi:transcriptional regulator with XRE-family HTH domain